MKLVVTVYEETCSAAIEAIRAIALPHDMVEVRAERFPSLDCAALRGATEKPILLTFRGGQTPVSALEAGIDFIDVEWPQAPEVPERTVYSHHDYEGMRDVETIMSGMWGRGCAHTKLAATPRTFAENERLLALMGRAEARPTFTTVIGMGEGGLYSRILAPFLGSELAFVAASNVAAPGQLTLARAHEIYGVPRAEKVFAIVGNPAGHSLSPVIHNALFREKKVPAAYTIASFESFDEIKDAFLRGKPCGLSVTTPFKEEAFRVQAEMGENAKRARAVNTLVNVNGTILSDNTDVDGFRALIPHASEAAVLGRGPTARAALVALEDANIPATMFTRENMHALRSFELIVNTLPPEAEVEIPPCRTYIEAAYSGAPRNVDAQKRIGGLELLHAQAVRQHELFMKVFDGS
ncbi:MAG TPA: type I 3-dehydroquinate dehydratase [Thermoanaerobaculia bacterium]|nr:type I 3-dehydroquinate dehydratase [Thermoanaerobaculia bacterium]